MDDPEEALAGAFVSLVFDPFADPEPEPLSDAFFSDPPLAVASLPFDSLPEEDEDPFDAPSLGRESVR